MVGRGSSAWLPRASEVPLQKDLRWHYASDTNSCHHNSIVSVVIRGTKEYQQQSVDVRRSSRMPISEMTDPTSTSSNYPLHDAPTANQSKVASFLTLRDQPRVGPCERAAAPGRGGVPLPPNMKFTGHLRK